MLQGMGILDRPAGHKASVVMLMPWYEGGLTSSKAADVFSPSGVLQNVSIGQKTSVPPFTLRKGKLRPRKEWSVARGPSRRSW